MPLTLRSRPCGRGRAAIAGAGRVVDAGPPVEASRCPKVAAPAAPRVTAPAPSRNVRRPSWAVGYAVAGSSRRASPVTGRRPRRAVSRPSSTATPVTAAATPGSASTGVATGRVSAARVARPVSSRMNTTPSQVRRRARTPATADASRVTTVTLPSRIGLSRVPNCATAYSLTGVGVASMTADPTARTGEDAGSRRPATRCPTAIPATAARTPVSANGSERVRRSRAGCRGMRVVRSGGPGRMAYRGDVSQPPKIRRAANIPAFLLTGGVIGLVLGVLAARVRQ